MQAMYRPAGIFLLLILPIPTIVFYALALTGCISTSPIVPNVFLVRLRPSEDFEVRVGYFGLCVVHNGTAVCGPSPDETSLNTSTATFQLPTTGKTALKTALDIQSRIFLNVEVGAAIAFIVCMFLVAAKVYLNTGKRNKFQSQLGKKTHILVNAIHFLLSLSVILSTMAAYSVTQTGRALAFATTLAGLPKGVAIKPGTTLQVFQWLTFGFSVAFSIVWILWERRNNAGAGGVGSYDYNGSAGMGPAMGPAMDLNDGFMDSRGPGSIGPEHNFRPSSPRGFA